MPTRIPFRKLYQALIPSLLFLLITTGPTFSQSESFRGVIRTKIYDLLHQPTQGRMAQTLAKMTELPITEFDTLYETAHVCGDTLVTYVEGVDGRFQLKNIEFGKYQYIFDEVFLVYLKVPKPRNRFNQAKAADWRRHRREKDRNGFTYNYSLIKPNDKKLEFFALVDPAADYTRQTVYGGRFGNILHPEGQFQHMVFQDGYTEVLYDFEYTADPSLSCEEHFYDFLVKDIAEDARELMEYDVDTTTIAEGERRDFQLTGVRDTSLSQIPSWSEFAGKYVYVDLWASWCAPCRLEMPYMARLRKDYPEERLALLSLSLDEEKDHAKWLQSMEVLRMDWTNWIVPGGFESEFAKAYGITAIPRYLLLDPRGRIVNDNAPRPSDDRLKTLLDKVLGR